MYKFFRENQKRLLAIFGVILMIAFVMPTSYKNPTSEVERVQGWVGQQKVLRDDVREAEDEWNFLMRYVEVHSQGQSAAQSEWTPIIAALGLPQEINSEMATNPEFYYLLQYEARKMGLSPQYATADEILGDPSVVLHTPDGRRVNAADLNDLPMKTAARQYLANVLMVQSAFRRAVDAVKVSEPLVEHQLAGQLQQIKVRVIDFAAKDYDSKVVASTPEQLQKQFDLFGDVLQDTPASNANPFGFGYRYPNRVKFQYLQIPRAEVRKAVQAQKTDYAWDVDANRYYLEHQSEFPTTQPAATQPASTQESLTLGATTRTAPGPTTRAFAEVRQEILDKLIDPQVDRLQGQIQNDLTARLGLDYEAWLKTQPTTTAPATAPAAVVAGGYESFEYLQKLAENILTKYRVTLTVASIADSFKTSKDIQALSGIGQIPSFADYVTTAAEPFVPAAQKSQPGVMRLFQPSKALPDEMRNTYIFRITAADPTHKPASISEVKDQVEQDWKRQQAFDLAKADAQKLLEAARNSGIESAAGDRKVVQTGAYPMSASAPIEDYPLSTRSQPEFVRQTYTLLGDLARKDGTHPVALIEMPPDGKVAVAQLVNVESGIKPESFELAKSFFSDQIAQQYRMGVANNWFDYNSLVERLGYQDDAARRKATGGEKPE